VAAILVTDDDEELRLIIRRALEGAGHSVWEAADGAEALRHLERERTDLVITDMHMPGMDGLELARMLRKAARRPALIGISGNDFADTLEMAKRLGARATLAKPFSPSQLLEAVDAALDSPPP
jgi:two-component system chemotaxis response regulator CheY